MKTINSIGLIVLAVWLIVSGLITLFQISIPWMNLVVPILAILAGILLLLRIRDAKASINLGFLLLSVWLILTGLGPIFNVNTPELGVVMWVLGIAAGVLILVGQ